MKSLKRYDIKHVAMASLFLASKVDEAPRRPRELLNVFYHIDQIENKKPIKPLDWRTEQYIILKDYLIKTERHILKDMGFTVYVEHPHKYLVEYLKVLDLASNNNLCQRAWNYANDSQRTTLSVQFSPQIIATGCLYYAARVEKIAFPDHLAWWEIFDAELEVLDQIAYTIHQLYKLSKSEYVSFRPPPKEETPPKKEEVSPKKKSKRSGSSSEEDLRKRPRHSDSGRSERSSSHRRDRDGRDGRDGRDYRSREDSRDRARTGWDSRGPRGGSKDTRDPRGSSKDTRDAKTGWDARDTRDSRDLRDNREAKYRRY